MADTVVWRIIDGDLPFLYEFPVRYDIQYTSEALWQIDDGELPHKKAFPHRYGLTDVPNAVWAIKDGELPYKRSFPPMYKIQTKDPAPKPPYFTFKGVDSTVFGALEMDPLCMKHEQKTNIINIPGQTPAVQQTGTYKSKVITLSLGLPDISPNKIVQLNQWLVGTGRLIFSRDPDRYYMATCNGALTGQRILRLGKLPVQFNVMPFKYKVSEEFKNLALFVYDEDLRASVEYEGNVNGDPVYRLYLDDTNDAEITVGDSETITIKGNTDYIEIDVAKRKVTDANGDLILDRTYGDFTKLQLVPGTNYITVSGNVSGLKVKNNTRWF